MTKNEFEKMLNLMAEAWANRKYETVAAQFAEHLFYSDSLNYSFSNRADLSTFFEDDGGHPQKCDFHQAVFDKETQIGAAEYTYIGTFCYHGTVWIKLKNDKIIEWREYQYVSDKNWNIFWSKS